MSVTPSVFSFSPLGRTTGFPTKCLPSRVRVGGEDLESFRVALLSALLLVVLITLTFFKSQHWGAFFVGTDSVGSLDYTVA